LRKNWSPFFSTTHASKQPDFFPRIREHKKEYFGECKGAAEEAKPPFFLLARTLKFIYIHIYIYIYIFVFSLVGAFSVRNEGEKKKKRERVRFRLSHVLRRTPFFF